MAAVFFQNGLSIGASAGWCGYTGSNNYVVRYEFRTDSRGADSVSIVLSGIYYGSGAGTQGFGFKVSQSSVAYANARNILPDSNVGYMRYSEGSGYGCTLTATGLNLSPDSIYYLFVFVAGSGAEYYSGWNCVEPRISCGGAYAPAKAAIGSISASVSTGDTVSLIISGSSCPYHVASFSHRGVDLGESAPFGASLSHVCPRDWLACDINAESIAVDVSVQGYQDALCQSPVGERMEAAFVLRADSMMRPKLDMDAISLVPVNEGAPDNIAELISGISRVKVSFDTSRIDLGDCARAELKSFALSYKDKRISSDEARVETGIINGETVLNCTVMDTRGREGSISVRLMPLPYVPPSLTETEALRCDEDGTENSLGRFCKIRAKTLCTELEGKNSCTVTWSIRPAGAQWSGEETLANFESGIWSDQWGQKTLLGGDLTGDSYTLALTVRDLLGSAARYTTQLYHQRWAMKFNKGGTALGLGMEPTVEKALQLPDNWKIYAGALVLSEASYGYAQPETAVSEPVQGQLYFLLTE